MSETDKEVVEVNCPDCAGVLSRSRSETGHVRYICQIGHAYSAEEMVQAKEDQIENAMWSVMTLLEHLETIYRDAAGHEPQERQNLQAAVSARLKQAEAQRKALRQLIEETRRPELEAPAPHKGQS